MKKKIFGKLGNSVLAVVLAVTMLMPSVAFAQDNSSDVNVLEENAIQGFIENGEAITANRSEIDFNNLPDATEILTFDISDFSVMSISDEDINRIEISDEIDAKEIRQPFDEQQIYFEKQSNIDVDLPMEQRQEMPSTRGFSGEEVTRAIGNNSPATAIQLPSTYFGLTLSNLATNNEDWYFFDVTGNGKSTIAFVQQPSGQYAIILYKLDSTGTILNQVDYSAYSGTFQQIDYLASAGRYYLQILPLSPPTTSYNYQFEVYVSYSADSYELNENPNTAYSFTNSMNVSANIDNPFDEDWYKLTLTSQKDLDITAAFAQKNEYAVLLYDSNFNSKGSFYIDGALRSIVLSAGTYYVRVVSLSGYYSDSAKYTLKIVEYVPPAPKPLGTITIPSQRLDYPSIYELSTKLTFEPGGYLLFDMNCSSVWSSGWDRLGVVIDVRFDGYNYAPNTWERLGDFWVTQGSKQYTYDFPYRMDHIVGRPLWPGGTVRITLVPDGSVDISGTIKSMPH